MAKAVPNISEADQSVVTLKVGPNSKVFLVHTSVICNESPFFEKAFKSEFKEGKTQVMTLEDTEEEVFKLVMQWLYTRQLPELLWSQLQDPTKVARVRDGEKEELLWDFLMSSAYIFSQTYAVHSLSNAIEGQFDARFKFCFWNLAGFKTYLTYPTIIRLFNNVPEDSRVCKLFIDEFAKHWATLDGVDTAGTVFDDLPANFLSQALKATSKQWSASFKNLKSLVTSKEIELEVKSHAFREKDKELREKTKDMERQSRAFHRQYQLLEYNRKELRAKEQHIKEMNSTMARLSTSKSPSIRNQRSASSV
ncbi:hypothetical protein IWX49DRAFT_590692 [Phyllosticta citricarpa]|uniref:BTB domain-containing protein n=2 Tax=Phyllosticta TaxID=121621 RepID=A0ABR1MPY4_9PEZI